MSSRQIRCFFDNGLSQTQHFLTSFLESAAWLSIDEVKQQQPSIAMLKGVIIFISSFHNYRSVYYFPEIFSIIMLLPYKLS